MSNNNNEGNDSPATHESYGLMQFSRTNGTPRNLFGSTIEYSNTIVMSVSEGEISRRYQHTHYNSRKTLIEVEMSGSQFAEAITSMNVGEGVPVTIRRISGVGKIQDPPKMDFKQRAKNELKNEMERLANRVNELSKDAKDILTRKGTPIKADEKEKLLNDLHLIVQEIRSNIPFAHQCFQESVNETVVEAKSEIDATLISMREKIGQTLPKELFKIPLLNEHNPNTTH